MEPDDILDRLAALEKRDGELGTLDYLRDALIVSSAIQDRVVRSQRQQLEDLTNLREFTVRAVEGLSSLTDLLGRGIAEHEQRMAEHEQRMAHIDQTSAEINDKLNALIDIVDPMRRPPQPPPA